MSQRGILDKYTNGPLAPGLTSHCKFADDVLKTLQSHTSPGPIYIGLFHSSSHDFGMESCTKNKSRGVRKLLKFTCIFRTIFALTSTVFIRWGCNST